MGVQDFSVYDLIARNARIFPRREAWITDQRRITFLDFYNDINNLSFSLEKKSYFSKSKIIYRKNSHLAPQEMNLFERGMEICSEDYYLAKWTVLPKFFRNKGVFSIKFFFLEPMNRTKAIYLQIDFDVDTGNVSNFNQRFGSLII